MSVWTSAISPATTSVSAPRMAAVSCTSGAASNMGAVRKMRYTPATTIVAAWMSAETGVGPSIASGSHVWSGSCADFATAPPRRPSATSVATVELSPSTSCEDGLVAERARLLNEEEERERERGIADRVHDERLLRRRDCRRPLVLEADQEVRREADEAPGREQHQEVPALDEQEHREDEERHVREEAALLVDLVHVADRVADDERADAGDDEHHEDGELVDVDL